MGLNLKHKKTEFYVSLGAVILGLAACIITSVMGGYVTFAWFSANRTVSATANNLVVAANNTIHAIKVYPFYDVTAAGGTAVDGTLTFSKTASTSQDMGDYSILKQNGNGVLIEADLTAFAQSKNTIDITAHSNATTFLGQLDSSGTLIDPLKSTGNSLSSVVHFYAFASSSITGLDDSAATYYSVALSSTINPNAAKMTFVSDNKIVTDQQIGTITGPNVQKVFFVLDYDIALIEQVYSANLGNDVANGGGGTMKSDGQTYLSYLQDFYFWINAID
jgi:hypothetical protein